jgi:hypothetical protein
VEQGCGSGGILCHVPGPEIVEAFVQVAHTLLAKDIVEERTLCGFLVYALAEHT